ncbi:hypothetical protein HMPREF9394_1216 [Streptococcus sanguinis SK1057]|nr:hypothetical protein HMPREF9394_1216 [Streptococcus sanguinis SK1057]
MLKIDESKSDQDIANDFLKFPMIILSKFIMYDRIKIFPIAMMYISLMSQIKKTTLFHLG